MKNETWGYYCHTCEKIIDDADIVWGWVVNELRREGLCAPAERDDPECPGCGSGLEWLEVCPECDKYECRCPKDPVSAFMGAIATDTNVNSAFAEIFGSKQGRLKAQEEK